MQLCGSLSILWHCLSLGLEWKLTFSSPVATDECSKFAGILSVALSQHHLLGFEIAHLNSTPPLALFVVMLPKAHLTSHSRMSSSRWVNHTIMIIWVVKIFSVLFCVFLPPLNIVCFCLVHTISVLYWTHLCMKCSFGISDFLEEIPSLSHSKSWKMMLWKCCTQYASKFGTLSSGHRTGKGQFSFQYQRKAMPKNAQTTAQLHSSHTLVK